MVDILIFRKGKSTRLVITIAELIIWENPALEIEDYQKGQQKISLRFYLVFGFQNQKDLKVFKVF